MTLRLGRVLVFMAGLLLVALPLSATFCVPGSKPAQPDPPSPTPPVCEPKRCDRCSKSPCYLATGMYVDDFVDLQIPTIGMYPLTVSRRYDSSRPSDGPLGTGWSSSLTARLYYAAYLFAFPATYSYEADIVMPDGVTYQFATDASGAFTPPFGRHDALVRNGDGTYSLTLQHTRSVYRFNSDGSLASLTDDYGNVIAYTYASGRLQRIADSSGSGRYIDVTWGPDGRIASIADNTGRILKYFYEGNAVLTSFSNPLVSADSSSRTTYYSYVPGRFGPVLGGVQDRWHRAVTQLEWSSDGKLKSYTQGQFDAANPNASPGEKYTYTYAPAASGGSVTKANSLGSKTYVYTSAGLVNDTATYDALGNVATESTGTGTRIYEYDAQGNVVNVNDGLAQWGYFYDANFPAKVASIICTTNWARAAYEYVPPGSPAAGALAAVYRIRSDTTTRDRVAAYAYDAHGHVTQFTDENGVITVYTYSSAGDLASVTAAFTSTTSYTYDPLGRQTSLTTPDGQVTTYAYDALDRMASVTLPRPASSSALNFVTSYSYDNYDSGTGLSFTTVTDPNSRVTRSGDDALGNLVQAVDALGNITKYTYQYNLLAKITDANGNQTAYTHNGNGDLTDVTFPDGASEHYIITNGVLTAKTDRNGQGVSYWYDSIGRPLAVSYPGLTGPGGVIVGQQYIYNDQNLIQVVDTQPAAKTQYLFNYDSSWRRTSEQIVGGGTTTYTWSGSLLQSYTIAPGYGNTGTTQTVTYGYDSFSRVLAIQWSWIPSQAFLFAYNSNGQYSTITFPNGQSRVFAYDNQGRLTNVTNKDVGGSLLGSFDYGYDYDWGTSTYTMLGQRTSVTVASVPGTYLQTGVTKYQYDARYQLTRADPPNNPYDTWSYDAIGNRTASRFSSYTYYKNGQNPLNGQRMRSFSNSPDLAYDANGSLTGYVGSPSTYAWDYAGRLTAAPGASYTYDYQGHRSTGTAGNTTTRYITLGMNTVGERNATLGVSTDYLFGPGMDEPLAKHATNGAISYYAADGLGSIALVTDENSAVIDSSTYDAWGTRGGGTDLFGYTGREASGSLWYYRARFYDPTVGRFISEDPLGLRGGTNLYTYANADPVSLTDPSGLSTGCGDIPRREVFPTCKAWASAAKQFQLCNLAKVVHVIHGVSILVAVAFGLAASAETTPIGGCLVGLGTFALGYGAGYGREKYGEAAIEATYQRNLRDCEYEACLYPPQGPGGPPSHPTKGQGCGGGGPL